MSKPVFLAYPKCSTCKRAQKWLDDNGYEYEFRHIVDENPSAAELAAWHERSGKPIRGLFNTSGMLYRERNLKAVLDAGISDADAYALLAENGMLVKRPALIGEGFALFGFREEQWAEALGALTR